TPPREAARQARRAPQARAIARTGAVDDASLFARSELVKPRRAASCRSDRLLSENRHARQQPSLGPFRPFLLPTIQFAAWPGKRGIGRNDAPACRRAWSHAESRVPSSRKSRYHPRQLQSTSRQSSPRKQRRGKSMRTVFCALALLIACAPANAADKPDWAFPVTEKVQPPPNEDPAKIHTAPGSAHKLTRAQINDMTTPPTGSRDMYPPMPPIVQHGNRERQVRACGSCHLPTGTGHDESAYMASLPVAYFIRQMADWKSGDRKYGGTMVAMAKVITDAEIREAADYFASLKPRPWIRV